jgi:hypothetical protein
VGRAKCCSYGNQRSDVARLNRIAQHGDDAVHRGGVADGARLGLHRRLCQAPRAGAVRRMVSAPLKRMGWVPDTIRCRMRAAIASRSGRPMASSV